MRSLLMHAMIGIAMLFTAQPSANADDWCAFVISPRVRMSEKPSGSAVLVKWNPSTVPLRLRYTRGVNSLQVVENERWLQVQHGWVRESDVVSLTDAVDHFHSAAPSAFTVASLSRAYRAQGKTAEALAEAKRAVEMYPNDGPARLAHAVALSAAGELDAAEVAFTHAILIQRDWCEPYRECAEFFVLLKRYHEAAYCYGDAIERSPGKNYALYMARGIAWRNCDELEASRRDFLAATKMPEATGDALSEHHAVVERIKIAELSESLKSKPNDPAAYLNRANGYCGLGEIEKALSDYAMAQRLGERPYAVCGSRAELWRGQGEYGRMIADLEAAIQDDNEVNLQRRLAWILATCPSAKHRDGHRAVAIATGACEATGWSIEDFIVCLGAAYAESGNFESAIKEEGRALQIVQMLQGDDAAEIFLDEAKPRLDAYRAGKAWRDGVPARGN